MSIQCTDAMLEAFKATLLAPSSDNETMRDLYKNAIEAALLVWHQEKYPRELTVIGYMPNGHPIYDITPGMIASAAVVSCNGCRKVIRGMGGPIHSALCPDCYEAAGL